jgi:hypothetical protein
LERRGGEELTKHETETERDPVVFEEHGGFDALLPQKPGAEFLMVREFVYLFKPE